MKAWAALGALLSLVVVAPAMAQQQQVRPPVVRFPMSANDFRRLIDFNIDLTKKHESKLTADDRAALQRWILEVRECTAVVTADGVVTKREADRCFAHAPDFNHRPG